MKQTLLWKPFTAALLAFGAVMATTPSIADTRADGSFLNEITDRYVTPHLDWAHPLTGGAPRVLFFTPRKAAREIVELSQRMPLQRQAIVTHSPAALALDAVYESMVTGTSSSEKAREVTQKLNADYDTVVLGNVSFNALAAESQFRLLEKVAAGTGLVLVYPSKLPEKLLSAPTDAASQILQMAGTKILPGDATTTKDSKMLQTFRFGKGRIAVLDFPVTSASQSGGLSLTAFEPYIPAGWAARYENNMALTARAIQWAAGRDISQSVRPRFPANIKAGEKTRLAFSAQNVRNGNIHLRVRDVWNNVGWRGTAQIKNGEVAPVLLPPLAAGTHYLDVQLEREKDITAFGVFDFEVASPVGKLEISTDRESYERGTTAMAKVLLTEPLSQKTEVVMRLEDLPARAIWQRQSKVISPGQKSVSFTFPAAKLPSIAGAFVVEIRQDGQTLVKDEHIAFFPRREKEIFPTLFWGTVPSYLAPFYAKQLVENMNDAAGVTHPDGTGEIARQLALVNQRYVPYLTRIGITAGKDGKTLNNNFFGLDKAEIDRMTGGDGSFHNPAVRSAWKASVDRRIVGLPRVGPMIYTLGDENGFSYDAGYSPADNAAWPQFLQSRYGNIEALNREWETQFSKFEEVPHYTPQQMRDQRLFPAWYEHRRFMEKQYADVTHFLAQYVKSIDPHAIVGAEGSMPGELEQTISGLEFWGPYSDEVGDELLRSIGSDKLRMLWWGYGPAALKNGPYVLWRPLLQGVVNGSAFYSSGLESMGLLSVDLSFADYFQKLRPALDRLDKGQAQTLIETPLKKDGIAILWSHASHSASFMDDRFFSPGDSATAFTEFCYRNGLNFDYLTTRMAENGALENYKVLCLFGATALSEKEVEAIEAFTRRGGVVIADVNPGILSEYLRPLAKSRMADFFGAPGLQGKANLQLKSLNLEATMRGEKISLRSAKVFQSPEAPVFTVRDVEKGTTVLLNFNLGSAYNTATEKDDFDRFMLNLLKLGNIAPQVSISGLSSNHNILRVRENAAGQVVGVLASADQIGHDMTLHLPRAGWVYEVNKGLLGHAARVQAKLDTPFKLYSVFTQKQNPPVLKLRRNRISTGQHVSFDTAQLSPLGVYRVDILSPQGKAVQGRTKIFKGSRTGQANEIRFAFNDVPGRYQVVLTDVRTGLQTIRVLNLIQGDKSSS